MAEKYDNADMSGFYEFITPYLKGKKLLDIGCGSGRDIEFYLKRGFKVTGVDPAESFLKICKTKYPKLKFFNSAIQNLQIPINNFDVISVAAVWMHLKRFEYYSAVKSIKIYLKKRGVLILSYSTNKRDGFDYINYRFLKWLFVKNGFVLKKQKITNDSLNRNIKWITQIYVKIT